MWLNKDKLIKLVFIYCYIRLQYIILFCVWLYEHLNKSIGEKINSHIPNAVPTAEGAIEIAITETPFTIHGSKSLVLGYGKIGKILSKDLYALGAQTYVEARKYADLAMIEGHGYEPLPLDNLKDHIHEFDIIFNTIPSLILDDEILTKVKKDALIIDLASKPGGIDFDAAKAYGLKVIWALSLPGKIAPVSSGAIIKDTIMNIIKELGV